MSTKAVCFKFRMGRGWSQTAHTPSPFPSYPNLGCVTDFVEQIAQIITENTLNAL
jgi:hypothetical protein